MKRSMIRQWLLSGVLLVALVLPVVARASLQDTLTQLGTTGWSSSYVVGEVAKGATAAIEEITKIMKDLIDLAVTVSKSLDKDSDKMAGGLAVITIIVAFIRFAATKDPVAAWGSVFEDLAILGIFASVYLAYGTWAPGFYKWFNDMAIAVSGTDAQSLPLAMVKSAGAIFDAVNEALKAEHWWTYIALLINLLPLLFAWVFLEVAALVFSFTCHSERFRWPSGSWSERSHLLLACRSSREDGSRVGSILRSAQACTWSLPRFFND